MSVTVTNHAIDRFRERYAEGNPLTAAEDAWEHGTRIADMEPVMRNYVDYLSAKSGRTCELVLFDGFIWVFDGRTLVTVYEVDYPFAYRLWRRSING